MKDLRFHPALTGVRTHRRSARAPWFALAGALGVVWYLVVVAPGELAKIDQVRLGAAARLLGPVVAFDASGEADARRLVIELRRALPTLERADVADTSVLRTRLRRLEDSLRLGTYEPLAHRHLLEEVFRQQIDVQQRLVDAIDESGVGARLTFAFVATVLLAIVLGTATLRTRRRTLASIGAERMGRLLFEHSPESVSVADASERIVAVNPAFERVTGYTEAEVKGRTLGFDASGEQDEGFFRTMRAELARVGRWTGEIWQRRKNGEAYAERVVRVRIDDDVAHPLGYLTVSMDLTPTKDAVRLFNWQAHHDALTKLPNRTLLLERLTRELVRRRQSGHQIALLSVDIDSFKRINDSVGPMLGDRLLTEASMRIVISVAEGDTVARLGSDKFAVMLSEIEDPTDAGRVARRILDAFSRPFVLAGREVVVTASIGVALFPEDGGDALRLLQRADAAMAQAKGLGGNSVAFFETEMNTRAERRHAVETDLRRALKSGQLTLHYQPVVDRLAGRVVGAEALVRWQHPEWGLVAPGEFIPVAEESGLIVDVGRWVIEAVRAQLTAWRGTSLEGIRVAVNLSAAELRRPEDVEAMKRLIARVPANQLAIEITESVLMADEDRLLAFLAALRDLNVRVALDDFGTGYSSLSYLRRFRFDVLKIDRSFVKELDTNDADLALVTSIVSLGRNLSLEVVAEGVETPAQLARLAQAGCNLVQGFYFARPMPPVEFAAYVASGSLRA